MSKLDFILIHGYILLEDGLLDPILVDRMEHGLDLFLRELGSNIIVAGKHGLQDKEYYEKTKITEAKRMRQYLEEKKVDPSKIFEECEGTNTFDCTSKAYQTIIKPNHWTSGVIVSSREHLPRIIIQTNKIIPPEITVLYSGPMITDPTKRAKFVEREAKATVYSMNRPD